MASQPPGRPRSEAARTAVLHAVDDLLVEIGYAAMTMQGIAERAGVSRQTVYRWWSTKAEILLEATAGDAEQELAVTLTGDPLVDASAFLQSLVTFVTHSPAGAAYRALLGEAQHDSQVAELIRGHDVIGASARPIVKAALGPSARSTRIDHATAQLVGPVLYWILSGRPATRPLSREMATAWLRGL